MSRVGSEAIATPTLCPFMLAWGRSVAIAPISARPAVRTTDCGSGRPPLESAPVSFFAANPMADWKRVKWTEARQVAELLDWSEDLGSDAGVPPQAYFARLREAGRLQEAALFLGQALPRYEAVVWAAGAVRELCPPERIETAPLKAALQWVKDPTEKHRREAYEAAGGAPATSAARMVALAVFFSGGSMSPDGQPPVPAPREAAGR